MLLPILADSPEPRKIRRVVDVIERGGIVAYPTDTVYGLGCDLLNKRAVDRLYQLKSMPKNHPLAFICADLSDIARYASVDNKNYRILKRLLPGPYCFILPASREVPRLVQSKRKSVGIRVPDHAVTLALVSELGRPLISTTAQREGEAPHVDPHEIDDAFSGIDLVIDGGPGGLIPTTVVDLTTDPPTLIREGAGPADEFV